MSGYTFGFDGAIRGMRQRQRLIQEGSESALTDCALLVQGNAVEGIVKTRPEWAALTPGTILGKMRAGYRSRPERPLFRSGAMMMSIDISESPGKRMIGTSVGYSIFHEKGRGRMRRPFMIPALEESKSRFKEMFETRIRLALARASLTRY